MIIIVLKLRLFFNRTSMAHKGIALDTILRTIKKNGFIGNFGILCLIMIVPEINIQTLNNNDI